MAEWPWRYMSRSKMIMHNTPTHASDHLCPIWKESIQNCTCCRLDTTRCAIFSSFIAKSWLNDLEEIGQGQHFLMCDKPSYTSDHLCLMWQESIQKCRCYRADTVCRTDGQMEWNRYTPPNKHTHTATTLHAGSIKKWIKLLFNTEMTMKKLEIAWRLYA